MVFNFLWVEGDGDVVDVGGAGGGGVDAGEDTEGGGFACAVGSEEADDVALFDGEGEVMDGFFFTVGFGEVLDFDAV